MTAVGFIAGLSTHLGNVSIGNIFMQGVYCGKGEDKTHEVTVL